MHAIATGMRTLSPEHIGSLDRLWGNARNVCAVTHAHPDGDAIGSALGIVRYLKSSRGCACKLILDDAWPDCLSFLFGEDDLRDTLILERDGIGGIRSALASCDLVTCTDFNTLSRAGDEIAAAMRETPAPRVLIDHHLFPDMGSFELVFSETEVSSASELAYCLLKLMPDVGGDASNLPEGTLTALMTGITTDTNNFANSVFPTTLGNCAEILAAGVDRQKILDALYNQFSERRVRALGDILSRRMRITEEGLAFIVLDEEAYAGYGFTKGDTEGLVNIPLSIKDVRMSMFLRQESAMWRVSIRAKGGTSAYRMSKEYFNGGGHELAAGGKLPAVAETASAADVEKYVMRCAKLFF